LGFSGVVLAMLLAALFLTAARRDRREAARSGIVASFSSPTCSKFPI